MSEFRYTLRRRFEPTPNVRKLTAHVVWVMLNPSTADDTTDDHTIRKCIGFSQRWGASSLEVVNLYARRATTPPKQFTEADIGEGNDAAWSAAIGRRDPWAADGPRTPLIVVAWGGTNVSTKDPQVARFLDHAIATDHYPHPARPPMTVSASNLHCIGTTRSGMPLHPSRPGYDSPLVRWECPKADR